MNFLWFKMVSQVQESFRSLGSRSSRSAPAGFDSDHVLKGRQATLHPRSRTKPMAHVLEAITRFKAGALGTHWAEAPIPELEAKFKNHKVFKQIEALIEKALPKDLPGSLHHVTEAISQNAKAINRILGVKPDPYLDETLSIHFVRAWVDRLGEHYESKKGALVIGLQVGKIILSALHAIPGAHNAVEKMAKWGERVFHLAEQVDKRFTPKPGASAPRFLTERVVTNVAGREARVSRHAKTAIDVFQTVSKVTSVIEGVPVLGLVHAGVSVACELGVLGVKAHSVHRTRRGGGSPCRF